MTVTAQTKKDSVVILDSVTAKKVIKDLVRFDVTKNKLKNCEQRDSLSRKRIKTLKEANADLLCAFYEKEGQSDEQLKIIALKDKTISREQNKKDFWKITTYLSLGLSFYLLLLK